MKKILVLILFSALFTNAYSNYKDAYNNKAYKEAVQLAENAAAKGDLSAAEDLCKMYLDIKEIRDYQKAAYYLLVLENKKGNSYEKQINRYKTYFKDGYLKNLESYITNLRSGYNSYKSSSETSQKGLSDLKQNLAEAESNLKAYKDKCVKLESDLNNAQYKIQRLENSQNQDNVKYADAQRQSRKSINELNQELSDKNRELEDSKRKIHNLESDKASILKNNAKLIKEYDELKEKYNSLIERCGSSSAKAKSLPKDITMTEDDSTADSSSNFMVGFLRGWYTLGMSPLNLFRPFSFSYADDPLTGIVGFPFVMVAETVPMTADIFNGLFDAFSFGYYGDNLYGDGKLTYNVFERNNEGFPWLNR